ncbi:type IV pilus biogenesis protein PilM [Metapseudomonas furukawaii]|uniref:type IV pilus biogenesis protein PilM n=1 Tax=Metapseudomonas furukawaii TaxID=1149133 RepID=UPI000687D362|nr:type IV pilus biogenesis protein PilM [Pseudomonas furukawaii]
MPALWFLLAILAFTSIMFGYDQNSQNDTLNDGELAAVAGNMLVYRNSVSAYASANPAVTGAISDATLGLPNWYRRHQSIGNFISGGRSYVFYMANDLPGLEGLLYERTQSLATGINSGGVLLSPSRGNTGITLPAQVPDRAVVLVQ